MNDHPGESAAPQCPGAILKREREARGLKLEEVAAVTRIGRTYLTALEEENYDRLPSPAYARGFLRSYCDFLHLDADPVLALYESGTAHPPDAVDSESEAPSVPARAIRRPNPLLGILVAGVLVAAYLAGGRDGQQPGTAQPVPRTPAVADRGEGAPPAAVPPPAAMAPAPPQEVSPTPAASAPASGSTVLTLSFRDSARMVMNVDGVMAQEYEVSGGDVIEWEGERFFAIELSNGAVVDASIGGKPVRPLGSGPVRVVLRTDGTIE